MPDSAKSQGAAKDVTLPQAATELDALPTPAVSDCRTQPHGQDLKRQQPEPSEDPQLGMQEAERPLKRLRKAEEAAADGPVPSRLQDSMDNRTSSRAEVDAEVLDEQRGTEGGRQLENGGGDREENYSSDVDIEGEEEQEDNEPEGEYRANDTICSKCDDGGSLVLCDGGCMRAFHAGSKQKEEGADGPEYVDDAGFCNPLNIGAELFMRLEATNDLFECPNCFSRKHQCFACKVEGTSDAANPNREVFRCTVGNCGKFYHARCLGKDPEEMAAFFVCPLHSCRRCSEGETEEKGEVIQCRRCPAAYHVGCLPKKILSSLITRVWITRRYDSDGNVLPPPIEHSKAVEPDCEIGQSLLYCMKHPMAAGEMTPEHKAKLFPRSMMRSWLQHIARRYPDLRWSRKVMVKAAEMKAHQEAKRLQAAQEAQAPKAAPKAVPKPAKKAVASKGAAAAAAAAADAPRRPASAKAIAAAPVAASRALEPIGSDEDEIPLAERIAAAKKKRPSESSPKVPEPEVSFIPFDDTPAESVPSVTPPPVTRSAQKQSSSSHLSVQQKQLAPPQPAGSASVASVQAKAASTEQAAVQGSVQGPAVVPAELPEGIVESLPRRPSEEEAAEEAASQQGEAPEDDMWAADADEEAEEAEKEADQATAEASGKPEREAAAAAAEAARAAQEAEAAAAAAAEEEQEPFLLPFERESYWTRHAMQQRLQIWWAEAEFSNPMSEVLASARMPKPYHHTLRSTVAPERLEILKRSVHAALQEPAKAKLLVSSIVNEMYHVEDNLRMVLAPLIHGDRYTSYGRHFTLPGLLEEVNRYLVPFVQRGDTVVDFSCGYNVWVPMLRRMCLQDGWEIEGRSFDIITAKDTEGFVKESWLEVKLGSLPHGDNLVIGLNPPFGKNGGLADEFVAHAAKFRPRIIVLIVPPATKVPNKYRQLLEDTELMKGEAFFKPGVDKASWNDVAPVTRILVREDKYGEAMAHMTHHSHVIDRHVFPQPHRMMAPQLPMFPQMPLPVGLPMYNMQQAF